MNALKSLESAADGFLCSAPLLLPDGLAFQQLLLTLKRNGSFCDYSYVTRRFRWVTSISTHGRWNRE